jgi:hypothetical protein
LVVVAGRNPFAEFIVVVGVGQADRFPGRIVVIDLRGVRIVLLEEFPVGIEIEIDAVIRWRRVGIGHQA